MISLEKLMILTPLQKLPGNVSDLGKIIVATSFECLPKKQKIAQSGHTADKCEVTWKWGMTELRRTTQTSPAYRGENQRLKFSTGIFPGTNDIKHVLEDLHNFNSHLNVFKLFSWICCFYKIFKLY